MKQIYQTTSSFIRWVKQKSTRPTFGQGMVEFALALPIFLLLVLGIFEFGRLMITYTSVYAAAREGARYGAAVDNLCNNGQIVNEAERVGFLASGLNITTTYEVFDSTLKLIGNSCAATKAGDRVIVTATAPFSFLTGLITGPGGGPIILRSTAKRTIIKQVFLEWTLAPASTSSTGATSTPTPTHTTVPGSTNTPTPTPPHTTVPGSTNTPTPTSTSTPVPGYTPPPQACVGDWSIHETDTTYYVDVKFTNPSLAIMILEKATITWNSQGGHILKHIELISPDGETIRAGTPETSNSPYIWIPDPEVSIPPGQTWTVRFVFAKPNTHVNDITVNFLAPDGSNCYITNP
jgi:Flp pilus assembly protein TadG